MAAAKSGVQTCGASCPTTDALATTTTSAATTVAATAAPTTTRDATTATVAKPTTTTGRALTTVTTAQPTTSMTRDATTAMPTATTSTKPPTTAPTSSTTAVRGATTATAAKPMTTTASTRAPTATTAKPTTPRFATTTAVAPTTAPLTVISDNSQEEKNVSPGGDGVNRVTQDCGATCSPSGGAGSSLPPEQAPTETTQTSAPGGVVARGDSTTAPVLSSCTDSAACQSQIFASLQSLVTQDGLLLAAANAATTAYLAATKLALLFPVQETIDLVNTCDAYVRNGLALVKGLESEPCGGNTACTAVVNSVLSNMYTAMDAVASGCSSSACMDYIKSRFSDPTERSIAVCSDSVSCASEIAKDAKAFAEHYGPALFAAQISNETINLARSLSSNADVNLAQVEATYFGWGLRLGITFDTATDTAVINEILALVDECNIRACNLTERGAGTNQLRAVNVALQAWKEQQSRVICQTAACNEAVTLSLASAQRSIAMTAETFPAQLAISGLVVESCIALAAVGVIVACLFWTSGIRQHLHYVSLTVAILFSALLRVVFFVIGFMGYGNGMGTVFSDTTFYVIDKLASLSFCLCMILFTFMWSKAIHADIFEQKGHVRFAAFICVAAAVGLTASVVALTVTFAQSFTLSNQFSSIFLVDSAEVLLAAFLVFVGACLLFYIFVTRRHLAKDLTNEDSELRESHLQIQIRALTFISIVVLALFATFVCRVIIVCLQQFEPTINYGDSIYIGAGRLLPEAAGSVLILCVALLSFYRARKVFSKRLSQRLLEPSTSSSDSDIPSTYANY